MIEVKNLTVAVGPKLLLDDVSARFESGKMNLIIGPNGAGKSTLIKVISRQLTPTSGTVLQHARDLKQYSDEELAKSRAVLSQHIDLAFPLTVWEVVMMGRYPHFVNSPVALDEQAVEESMAYFDVTALANRNYMTLSGGEKQRVHFARVLSQVWFSKPNEPRYLLLDEPLTFLDVHYQMQFMTRLRRLLTDTNLTVIGVVHDLNLAARFADTILLLNHARVQAFGSKEAVLSPEHLQAAFHLEPIIHRTERGFYVLFGE
ncbi:MAG TPA: heme ABC transporter ATP-binding protein [Cyclobacteriaceae bacterium]|nr:heme ABC transporter ATP-binding protein [Cyclobacteriaceae bacterium]